MSAGQGPIPVDSACVISSHKRRGRLEGHGGSGVRTHGRRGRILYCGTTHNLGVVTFPGKGEPRSIIKLKELYMDLKEVERLLWERRR